MNQVCFFEYDAAKHLTNAAKQGIDFEAVQEMWDGVVVAAPARFVGEDRIMAIGQRSTANIGPPS